MNAPILWIFLPAVGSVLLFLPKRKELRYILFIGFSLFFAFATFFVRIDQVGQGAFFKFNTGSTLNVLGRNFVLSQNDLFLIQFLFFFNAVWGVIAYFFRSENQVVPLGLLFSALLLAAYAVTPFLYSALIIEAVVILSIPLLVRKDAHKKDGISRYLIYQTLSMPFILLAGWFLAGGEITPVNPEQLIQAVLLLGLGFIFWLGIFPFHAWLPMVFKESSPMNSGYVFQLLFTFIFLLILKFINGFPWLREYTLFFETMRLLGTTMAVLGALGSFFQKNLLKLTGYIFIHTVGMLSLSVGAYPFTNIFLFTSLIGSQLISTALLVIAQQFLHRSSDEKPLEIANSSNWNFFAASGIILSLLTLSGMPLTIGFPPIQLIYQYVANREFTYFILLITSKILIIFSAFRIIKEIYKEGLNRGRLLPKSRKEWFLASLLILISIGGLFPQIVLSNFQQLVSGFENLIQ